MRDLFKILVLGIVLFFVPYVNAEQVKVLVIPDNIVSESDALDSYIYNASSEFFSNEVINILNTTDCIKAPTVSEERNLLKSNPSNMIPVRNLMNRYRTSYNIDFVQLKKIANKFNTQYVLLITSAIDSENYILRRTLWDFLNVGGATVIDPAYKISTYASLVDTNRNVVLWSDTFYKSISVCENRIITRGSSPQTEQLEKIKDYSRLLCPEIAQNVQAKVLSPSLMAKETNVIYYDAGNIDNVFTKKYRRWKVEGDKIYTQTKTNVDAKIADTKETINNKKQEFKENKQIRQAEKALKQQQAQEKLEKVEKVEKVEKLEVKAEPVKINTAKPETGIHNINFKKEPLQDQTLYNSIEIKKKKTNNLTGEFDSNRPSLRDYQY